MSFLYIDPGTGSMLFAVLVGIFSVAVYLVRTAFVKIKFLFSAGKTDGNISRQSFAVFSEGKRYWNVFKPICDEFEKRGEKLLYLTSSEDDPAFQEGYKNIEVKYIEQGNKAFLRLNVLKADIVLSTTPGLDVYQWKRSREVKKYIHVLHAPSDLTLYRMFGLDYYDAVLLSGDYQEKQIRELERIRNLPAKDLRMVGITYLDALLKRYQAEPQTEKDGKTTVLLAPSWGKNAIFSKYRSRIIESLLNTDYRIIIRPHPQSYTSEKEIMDDIMSRFPESDRIHWDRSSDNFESLKKADILISDFSGIIFDFALVFDRPVIYTEPNFDKAVYDAWWLEEEPWTFGALEKIGIVLNDDRINNLCEVVEEGLSSTRLKKGRAEIRKETWTNIGKAAESTVDYCIELRNSLQAEKETPEKSKNDKRGELA
ncbi:MAG: CDP-glycerol glycerophosphotransferase family protein [Lachnospiraceae bacterium]|nr:CDP-glycerol glycerophosphotransferase family protein [Lachnospiraceae bacterium]